MFCHIFVPIAVNLSFYHISLVSLRQMCGRKNTPIVRLCICENRRTFAAVNI